MGVVALYVMYPGDNARLQSIDRNHLTNPMDEFLAQNNPLRWWCVESDNNPIDKERFGIDATAMFCVQNIGAAPKTLP
jgi:hypothetical protein